MQHGNCRLCTTFGCLTYEHVPPRVAFNKRTRFKKVTFWDYIKEHNPLASKWKGKIEQGGVGYYSLCQKCNNFLGSTYVIDYQKYTNTFIEFARIQQFNLFEFTIHDFKALGVFKQIVSMFLSMNDKTFSDTNRDLAEFVLDPKSNNFPDRFRVFTYLNTVGQLRNLPVTVLGDLNSQGIVVGSEIAFPPLGHVLTIDFQGNLPFHHEITSFSKCKFDEVMSADFRICRLPTHLPFLLDYREKHIIKQSLDES